LRFNAVKRRLEGISQKALTQTLRRLERNGLVARYVIPVSPVAVEYSVTPLGRTLQRPFAALYDWTVDHLADVERAQHKFDRHPKR
jgi:DNA-binding HxlR family transcriptional regulator